MAVMNPRIEVLSDSRQSNWEGCLSIPGIRGEVSRPDEIILHFTDVRNQQREMKLSGFPAIIAQHETDHLDGILFLDRMPDLEKLSFEKEYEQYWDDKVTD